MSSNNDNAMTRFLFAILRQKNLKDIDWNQVAHDPILAQEITNGHAARMRYSRFKSAMLGLEPTRRNRTGPPRSRVTKSKKDSKGRKDDSMKSESATPATTAESTPAPSLEPPNQASQKIKQESNQYTYNSRLTPALTPSPVSAPTPAASSATMLQNRFLTPCSDTDKFSASSVMTSSPTSDMMHSHTPFDFHGPPCPDHDPSWPHSGTSYFAAAYPFDDYANTPCDHQHLQHVLHSQCQMGLPTQSIEADMEQANVKREEWSRYD